MHEPVLLPEVIASLKPEPNHFLIDGTVGLGGHAEGFLARVLPGGRLLGIDRDADNLERARERLSGFGESVVLVQDSYANVKAHAYAHGFHHVNAVLLDLGFSSVHVDDPSRGFSFTHDGPLDMRYDRSQALTAERIVNTWLVDELARIFRQFGEETRARQAAEAIDACRGLARIQTTRQLVACLERVLPRQGKAHGATRVFQALRIAVNDELGQLERALPDFVDLLVPGGRIAIISFHSLEDRLVKRFLKSRMDLRLVNKRVITPSQEEVRKNPRARSAKLRVAEKL
ncbi:16S rRNA (cytosine(1402)-N(4))-methyltransferase RsmH [Candidatus Uhrbacteria bacterium]|nr:16S rRNA (cytosine(1402)-N(4))-methyltransferase RsmH [Candidatus Uhrbacteria bacterium]